MRIIYTWFKSNYKKWYAEDFEIVTLITSLRKSLEYYSDIALYTDEYSKKLIDKYNLPIKIELRQRENSKLWCINKINVYEEQTKPFIHLDTDFIILEKLPETFENARIGLQHKEDFSFMYKDNLNIIGIEANTEDAYNNGIYVCNDITVNTEYCKRAREFAEKVKHIKPLIAFNATVEQYSLASVLKDLNIIPTLLTDNVETLELKGVIHLMHNKNSEKYYNKVKTIYDSV